MTIVITGALRSSLREYHSSPTPDQIRSRRAATAVELKSHTSDRYLASAADLLRLKRTDMDSTRGVVRIGESEGAQDRAVPLSQKALEQLRSYYKEYTPEKYLFEGQNGGSYSPRSIQALFKKAKRECGIKKRATVHTLRHSYPTHLLENGTEVRIIQELLGHKSSKTTEIYTHVSRQTKMKIPNPLDQLDL